MAKDKSKSNEREASRIKKLRAALNMTTREFSKLFGKTHATITHWENCIVEIPEIAIKLLDILEKEHSDKLKKRDRTHSQSL